MPVRPLDTLLALKAINLAPDLKANDRLVATALIEHFNRKTGQCDPSLERLARLLGISARTVIRSTARLVAAGLFRKFRHGGHLNRNSYEPIWTAFQTIEAAWTNRFNEGARKREPEMSPAGRQPCHLPGDTAVTQTYSNNNLPNETCLKRIPRKELGDGLRSAIAGIVTRSADAVRAAAERRWTQALHEQFVSTPVTYGEVLDAIDVAMMDAATDAEMRKPDAGIFYILQQLRTPNTLPRTPHASLDGDGPARPLSLSPRS
jgi:hypothetical protein